MAGRNWLAGVSGTLLMLVLSSPAAFGQTALPGGLEVTLLPGYKYEPKQGFDSIVGVLEKKEGLTITFEIGHNPPPGAPRFGGSFTNQALQLREADRLWLKEQTVGGRKFHLAYSKEQYLTITSATEKQGINFSVLAKTPEDIADAILMALSLTEAKPKAAK